MQVQGLALNLRLRGMHDAADLGTRLVQVHARATWRLFGPLWLAIVAAALCYPGPGDWVPMALLFCAKPFIDRTLLLIYARAAFGEPTGWATLWAARGELLAGRWLLGLPLRRLSPWRAYTQPIRQLEGQRGAALRARRALLLRGRRGAAAALQFAYAQAELVLALAPLTLLMWLEPLGQGTQLAWLLDEPLHWTGTLAYAAAIAVLEPFYVAAGFTMYLNRRVELEAWDVEQDLRDAFAR